MTSVLDTGSRRERLLRGCLEDDFVRYKSRKALICTFRHCMVFEVRRSKTRSLSAHIAGRIAWNTLMLVRFASRFWGLSPLCRLPRLFPPHSPIPLCSDQSIVCTTVGFLCEWVMYLFQRKHVRACIFSLYTGRKRFITGCNKGCSESHKPDPCIYATW